MKYGEKLKELREYSNDKRKISQKEIAELLEIKQQQYSEYEIGKVLIPINYLSRLADFYDVSIDYLLYNTDERKPYPKSIVKEK